MLHYRKPINAQLTNSLTVNTELVISTFFSQLVKSKKK